MAKIHVLAFLIILISLSYQKVENNSVSGVQFTPADLEGFFVEFSRAANIHLVSKSTMPCSRSIKQLILDGSDAIDELMNDEVWTGTVSIAEVLGGSSYVARNCTYSIDELSGQLYNYLEAFPTFESWTSMIRENASRNMVKLSLLSVQLLDEIKKRNPDFPKLGSMVGELVYLTLERESVQQSLRYLRQDPLSPAPMNQLIWTTLESAFEFLKNSQILMDEKLIKWHNNFANMLVFQNDAFRNFAASVTDEGIYLTLDSFTFLKPIILDCYEAGFEIGVNYDRVYKKIEANPVLVRTNFEQELFYAISDSVATYSQVYYKDLVGLNRILGDLVYRTLIREDEVEN